MNNFLTGKLVPSGNRFTAATMGKLQPPAVAAQKIIPPAAPAEEVVDMDYIISERPSIKVVREYFRETLKTIRSDEQQMFE
jgi:hypothetical protein